MKAILALVIASAAMTAPSETVGMTDTETRRIHMETNLVGDAVQITLIGETPTSMVAEYDLEVTGSSRTRHRGKSELSAGEPTVLSRVKVATNDGGWCAVLDVRQSDGLAYREQAGDCT